MIEFLAARAGGWFAAKSAKLIVVGLILLAIAFCAWRATANLRAMVDEAEARGAARESLKWQAQIAASNERIAQSQLAAERAVREADSRAASEIATLRQSLAEMERANAALPNADAGGLDRDRVRLLLQQSREAGDPKRGSSGAHSR